MSEAFHFVANSHSELSKKPTPRADDTQNWADSNADRLAGLLEDMDGLKLEIHERLRRVEAVKQAKLLIQEDALRSDALNRKLEEVKRTLGHRQPVIPQPLTSGFDLLHMPSRELAIDPKSTLPDGYFNSAPDADLAIRVAGRILPYESGIIQQKSASELSDSCSGGLDISSAYTHGDDSTSSTDPGPSGTVPSPIDETVRELEFASLQKLADACLGLEEAREATTSAQAAYKGAFDSLIEAKEAWKATEKLTHEVNRVLEESAAQLKLATAKEQQAIEELRSTQQELTTAYQFASIAAHRQHSASEFFRRASLWTIHAAAVSWVATIWIAWFTLPAHLHIWMPTLGTTLTMGIAVIMARWSVKE